MCIRSTTVTAGSDARHRQRAARREPPLANTYLRDFRSRCGIPAIRVYVRAADPDLKSEKNTILAIEPSGIDVRAVPQ